ncbi:DUF4886 domain-containing protein [Algisphaera agarilytica]|uniref:PEP-CTERM protein-sorting domain-containing protein n=1 Tax=Algisphaera agarilytica TaxID=1385975 RepID=A0A7X0H4R5_9BACT|nr:DUF4886 domain-containing protein [Algisphaera agarilytica]MBB6429229.1 hypothetical protein [Algisphaera agarilytica]
MNRSTRFGGILGLCLCATSAHAISVYHVGNSLTWDSQPESIDSLATSQGYDHNFGHHIRCNSSLGQIVADPITTCVGPTSFGKYDSALSGHEWDAVTLQPFAAGGATLGSEADAALGLIADARSNSANADTRFYIYSAWGLRYQVFSHWNSPVVDDDDTAFGYGLGHSQLVYERVAASTDAEVFVIPVGEVMYELALAITAGDLPGYTSHTDLFRDHIHASYGLGRYAASVTTFATLYGDDLDGVYSEALGASTSAIVNEIVLDTLYADMARHGVPEPTSAAIILGSCSLLALRRNKQHHAPPCQT